MNQYRCETCKNEDCPFGIEAKYSIRIIPNIMEKVGCASHSDFQNQREKVLDELEQWCKPEDNELDRHATKKGDYVYPSGRLLKKIKELRGER